MDLLAASEPRVSRECLSLGPRTFAAGPRDSLGKHLAHQTQRRYSLPRLAGQLHSSLLAKAGFRHAFFTRTGGFSEGPYESLNFSYAVGDDPARVSRNLQAAASELGLDMSRVFFPAQVHGAQCLELRGNELQREVLFQEADALVSGCAGLACAVRTADCVPILIADRSTGRVAAIHAGWRGLVAGVIGVSAAKLGGSPEDWVAAVGPHITQRAFEVSEEVAAQLEAVSQDRQVVLRAPGLRPHVDLGRIASAQLEAQGMRPEHIEALPGCTHSEPSQFFSFRRDGKQSGRHLAAIVPSPG